MASQTDLDQGGTYRQWVRTWMGPTLGWVYAPERNELEINSPGTYTLDLSTDFVSLGASAGSVTIQLPSTNQPTGRGAANARPGLQLKRAITIIDGGGIAGATPITIKPNPGDTIMGLSQIQISVNYGSFVLAPYPGASDWINIA